MLPFFCNLLIILALEIFGVSLVTKKILFKQKKETIGRNSIDISLFEIFFAFFKVILYDINLIKQHIDFKTFKLNIFLKTWYLLPNWRLK